MTMARPGEGSDGRKRPFQSRAGTDAPAEYRIAVHEASSIAPERRTPLLQLFDEIVSANWETPPGYWPRQTRVFGADHGIVLVTLGDKVVGFKVYRRLVVDAARIVYIASTNILPEHHGRGLDSAILDLMLPAELSAAIPAPLYLAWRTRNPIAWHLRARRCVAVAPNLAGDDCDQALMDLGRRVAKVLYPELPLEMPTMIMRGAYSQLRYRIQPRHREAILDALFWRHLDPQRKEDAVFSIGEVRRAVEAGA